MSSKNAIHGFYKSYIFHFSTHKILRSHPLAHFQQNLSIQYCWHPLLCRRYAHRLKDAQALGHCCQALGMCRLPCHTLSCYLFFKIEPRRTRQTLWRAVQMLTQKLSCQTIHDCPKVVPLHYESEWQ